MPFFGPFGRLEVPISLPESERIRRDQNPNVLNDLAWLLATRLDQAPEAESLARRAVQIAPGNPGFLDTLAESLWRQGKTGDAARVARDALALEGASPDLKRFLPPGTR